MNAAIRRLWLGMATGVALGGLAFTQDAGQPAPSVDAIDAPFQALIDEKRIPGAAILVAHDGRIAHIGLLGAMDVEQERPVERDTIFRIYSMTKPVAAVAVMMLVEEGKLQLSDPVERYVPELAGLQVYTGGSGDAVTTEPAARAPTVEDLLMHTAGFTLSFQLGTPIAGMYKQAGLVSGQWYHDPKVQGLPDIAARLGKLPLAYQPGAQWHYGIGIDIAGLVVERVSGQSFEAFLKTKLFDPLGMADTGFSVPADKANRLAASYAASRGGGMTLVEPSASGPYLGAPTVFSGSGGLVSTLDDYFRFAQMLANGGELDGVRVLKAETVDTLMTNHLRADQSGQLPLMARLADGGDGANLGFGYGGSVAISGDYAGEYGWGGAASTVFWVDRKNAVVAVFMTQVLPSGTVPVRDTLHDVVYQALRDGAL